MAWDDVTTRMAVHDGTLYASRQTGTHSLLERDAHGWLPVRDRTPAGVLPPFVGADVVYAHRLGGGLARWPAP